MEPPSSARNKSSQFDALYRFQSESETDVVHKWATRDAEPAPLAASKKDALPSPAPAPAPRAPASIAVARLSLADVLASRMQMHWFEVVAIVQGVCHAILQTAGPADPATPPLSHVALTSLGTVEISAGVPAADSPILFVRGILLAALPDDKPVQLRLFVLQLDSPSHIATLRDLSMALEYFERPGRSELIRAVVNRYIANGLSKEVEQPKTTPADNAKRLDNRWRPWVAAAIIVAGAAALFGMGRWWLNGTLGTKSRTSVSARLLAATRLVAAGNLQALGERIGLVSAPAPEKSEAVVSKEPSRHPRVRAAGVRREAPIEVPAASGHVLVVASPPTAHATAEGASALGEFAHEGGTVEIGAGVYDSRDADVTPPVELWPYLRNLRAGTSPAGIATFDLVIDETGAVQSARVQVPLKRWDHVMLLSAMKTWHFRPATKDGHPVKYRKQLFVDVPMY